MAKVVIDKSYTSYVGNIASKRGLTLTAALHEILQEHKNFNNKACTITNNSLR